MYIYMLHYSGGNYVDPARSALLEQYNFKYYKGRLLTFCINDCIPTSRRLDHAYHNMRTAREISVIVIVRYHYRCRSGVNF